MASVSVALAAGAGTAIGGHPHVVIIGVGRSVVLDLIDPEAEFDSLAATWETIVRPGKKPWRVRTGLQLATVDTEWSIGLDKETDVGPRLAAFAYIAQNAARVIVGHTTPSGAPFSTSWSIDQLRWRVRWRRHGDNAVTSVKGSMSLTEASAPINEGSVLSAGTMQAAGIVKPATARHLVSAGETIWTIAVAHYGGDPTAWQRIADANGLTDLRSLRPGQVLTLPTAA